MKGNILDHFEKKDISDYLEQGEEILYDTKPPDAKNNFLNHYVILFFILLFNLFFIKIATGDFRVAVVGVAFFLPLLFLLMSRTMSIERVVLSNQRILVKLNRFFKTKIEILDFNEIKRTIVINTPPGSVIVDLKETEHLDWVKFLGSNSELVLFKNIDEPRALASQINELMNTHNSI